MEDRFFDISFLYEVLVRMWVMSELINARDRI